MVQIFHNMSPVVHDLAFASLVTAVVCTNLCFALTIVNIIFFRMLPPLPADLKLQLEIVKAICKNIAILFISHN